MPEKLEGGAGAGESDLEGSPDCRGASSQTRRSGIASSGAGLLAAGSQAKMLSVYAAMDDFRPQSRQGDRGL